ncbi:MAG: hypothetical protein II837_14960 [Treponema sp.]|nr:hypothetical protein [Treponema sp.]
MKKSSSKKYVVLAMSAVFFLIPLQQSSAQFDSGPIVSAIEQFAGTQAYQEIQKFAQMIKDYEQKIVEYKELVNQGLTQAKQYKTQIDELQELYHQGKTFVTGDLPHFMSDLKADPISTMRGYTGKLLSLAQNADQAFGSLKNVKLNVNGSQYSLDQLAGISGDKWYTEICKDGFQDEAMNSEAKAWAGKLTPKDIAFIRRKYNMSPENYYKWYQKAAGFKQSCASALAACTQWSEDAKKNAKALNGYATEIAKMGMTDKISANEIGQMTNNLLLNIAQTLQPAMSALQQAQACTLQSYAVAEQGGASGMGGGGGNGSASTMSGADKNYDDQEAWNKETDREEAKFGDDVGQLYPSAPKNRGYPNMWGKSE